MPKLPSIAQQWHDDRLKLIPTRLFKIAKKKNGLEYRVNTFILQFLGVLLMIQSIFSFLRRGLQIRRNFSTTCTTLGTRGEKLQVDAALCGRSMVEMLGVLAIIGVLSVGAISGYSKAMFKYKLNKQAESFNILLNNAIQIKPDLDRAFSGERLDSELFDKLNLIPDGMTYKNNAIYDVFNNLYSITYYHHSGGYNEYIISTRMDISNGKASQRAVEICRNMILVAKENANNLYSLQLRSQVDEENYNASQLWGSQYCTNNNCLGTVTLSEIDNFCNMCSSEISCYLIIYLMRPQA